MGGRNESIGVFWLWRSECNDFVLNHHSESLSLSIHCVPLMVVWLHPTNSYTFGERVDLILGSKECHCSCSNINSCVNFVVPICWLQHCFTASSMVLVCDRIQFYGGHRISATYDAIAHNSGGVCVKKMPPPLFFVWWENRKVLELATFPVINYKNCLNIYPFSHTNLIGDIFMRHNSSFVPNGPPQTHTAIRLSSSPWR